MMSRRKEDTCCHTDAHGVMIGLISGAVLGAATAFLLSTKAGETFKENLCEACEDWSEKTKHFTESISENYLGYPKKRPNDHLIKVIGGLAGSILGISALIFLSSDASKALRQQLFHSFESLSAKSQQMAHDFTDRASDTYDQAHDQIESWVKAAREAMHDYNSKYDLSRTLPEKAVYWALVGIKLFQSLKKEGK
ncbi:MAG: YtxH domain-containing protein [Parachlamydiaceae bacterium]